MQCARAILSSVGYRAVQYFSTLSHKRHDFRKISVVTERKMCVPIFTTTFVRNIFHSKKNCEIRTVMYIGFHVKYPVFSSDYNET
jgi:hypothetical protein